MESLEMVDAYTKEIIRQLLRLFPKTYSEMDAYRLVSFYEKPMSVIGPFFSPKAWAYRLHHYQEAQYLPEQWLMDIQASEQAKHTTLSVN